jgi:hypothetical protein
MSSTWTETFYLTEWLPPRIYIIKNQLNLSLSSEKKRKLFLLFRMGDASHVSIWIGFLKKEKKQIRSHTPGYPARLFNWHSELRPSSIEWAEEEEVSFRRKNLWLNSSECIHQLYSIPIWQKPKGPGRALCCRLETNGPTRIFQLCICSDSSFFCSRRDNVLVVRPSTF